MSNENHEVFSRETITLQDGTAVELKPLVIGKKRKFMKMWSDHVSGVQERLREASRLADETNKRIADGEEGVEPFVFDENLMNDLQYDTYLKLSAMCLESIKEERTDKKFIEYLEGVLDEPTIFKIFDVCGGLRLGGDDSPN